MKNVTASFDANTSSTKKAKATYEILSKQVANQKQRVAQLTDMLQKSEKEFGANDIRTLKWKQAVEEASAKLKNLERDTAAAHKESSRFRTGLDKAGSSIKEFSKKAAHGLGSGLKKATVGGVKLIGGLTAAAGASVVALGKIGVDYNTEMENYTTNFKVMLGSTEKAAKKVDELKKMAAKTPFEMGDLANATEKLLAMGVTSEDTGVYLQQLGDISLGNKDKMNTLVDAFGKMNSTGKVSLEYINMMSEQGFNPLNVIAGQTGETMEQLYDRVSEGTLGFDEIKNAMAIATSEGGQFCGGMEQASKTTTGMMSTLKDNARALVGEVFMPISEGLLSKVLPSAINAVDGLTEGFRQNGVEGMVEASGTILGTTLAKFTNALPNFVSTATSIVHSLLKGIRDNHGSIADGAVKAVKALTKGFINMLPDLLVTGTLLLGKVAAGLSSEIPNLIRQVPTIVRRLASEFKANAPSFRQIGKSIVNGIISGIKAIPGALWSAIKSLLPSGARRILDDLFGGGKSRVPAPQKPSHYPRARMAAVSEKKTPLAPAARRMTLMSAPTMVRTRQNDPKNPASAGLYSGDTGFIPIKHVPIQQTVRNVSTNVNYGGFTFNVTTQPGQDYERITQNLMEQINFEIKRKEAMAFG